VTLAELGLQILLQMLTLAVGAAVAYFVAKHYYVAAANDLKVETAKLRKLISVAIVGMERAGFIRAARNEAGELTGLIVVSKDVEARYDIHGPDSAE